ncbi:hypothetical protein P4313_30570, partial [Bacillus tropicus]|nr:hypothetical protein [Bacillus tropicus]
RREATEYSSRWSWTIKKSGADCLVPKAELDIKKSGSGLSFLNKRQSHDVVIAFLYGDNKKNLSNKRGICVVLYK